MRWLCPCFPAPIQTYRQEVGRVCGLNSQGHALGITCVPGMMPDPFPTFAQRSPSIGLRERYHDLHFADEKAKAREEATCWCGTASDKPESRPQPKEPKAIYPRPAWQQCTSPPRLPHSSPPPKTPAGPFTACRGAGTQMSPIC